MRIKVTGYISIDDVDEALLDLEDPTGLTVDGCEELSETIDLDDMSFELVSDGS